ncbi:MAG: cobalamin biosynthesis protein P47K [Candidatus Hydrogenedentes bacterium]|nr:cobalamin biosynthesis protein P47K [Candidatus Hydrogenedentota bacterium]
MLGGFLGAGKTTAIAALARHLSEAGLRVGLISNDQSTGLVDTGVLRARGFSVEEIAGGCFCCRFDSLLDAAGKLSREVAPDVFLAEPVGSCTDLVATVSYPLRRIYGDRFAIAPLSVLVDPVRAARILGLEPGRPFSEKVVYIYTKQLEEADIIVLNKCDSIDRTLREQLLNALRVRYPGAEVFACSSRDGSGLLPWFDRLLHTECGGERPTMELDYERYGEGEALLGWLNATIRVGAPDGFVPDELLLQLARAIGARVTGAGAEIAHLKMTLDAGDIAGKLSAVSLVRSDGLPELRDSLPDEVRAGTLVLNLRAEADPETLRQIVEGVIAESGQENTLEMVLEHLESFRPGQPRPVHRDVVAAVACGS